MAELPGNSPDVAKSYGHSAGGYGHFFQAQQQISGLQAIDYFLAKQLTISFKIPEHSLLFHLFMALSESLRLGHSCLSLGAIANTRWGVNCDKDHIITHQGFIFPSETEITGQLRLLSCQPEDNRPIVVHQHQLYLRRYYIFEQELAGYISARLHMDNSETMTDIEPCLQQLFAEPRTSEIDWQLVSVANALNKNFSVIAGGPGTGKTYTVTKILAALLLLQQQRQQPELTIAMVAPTGKAAQRLSESIARAVSQFRGHIADRVLDAIPEQAQTIHRLLGVIGQSLQFKHHQHHLLAIDVLLIDEVSMVDLALMTRTFRALPPTCKVILLGDADQLPSVLSGSVLAELAHRPHVGYSDANRAYLSQVTHFSGFLSAKSAPADHLTLLTKSRRFDDAGGIGRLAAAVIAGDSRQSWQLLCASFAAPAGDDNIKTDEHPAPASEHNTVVFPDLCLMPHSTKQWLAPLVERYYLPIFSCNNISAVFNTLARFRVLCATRQGETGVDEINALIKSMLSAHGVINANDSLYHGLPIMISENNYALGLYNGDIGLIWRNEAGQLMAVFEDTDDNYRWLMPTRLPNYEVVYAMTIHKTQGSEFEHVVMVLPNQADNKLLSRELLYTGITRAKVTLGVATPAHVWHRAVETKVQRCSGLNAAIFKSSTQ